MTFLPVVGREMGVLARRSGFYWARAGTALASLLVLGWLLAITAQAPTLTLGRSIFTILSWVGLVYAMAAGVHATADCISEEKREGTLGLLFLTDLTRYDIVLGKLSASSFGAAYALLAILPMISLGLLVGGVSLREVAEVAAILANTLFFSLSLGVFISTLSRNERQAVFAAGVVVFLLTAGPFAVLVSATGLGSFATFRQSVDAITWPSLAYPLLMLQLRTTPPLGFGTAWPESMLLHHLLGWTCLILSCVILPRFVHETPRQSRRTPQPSGPRPDRAQRRRQLFRRKLLDENAFLWLASRESWGARSKTLYAWFLVLFFLGLFGWVRWFFPSLLFDLPVNLALLVTLHGTLKLWLASESCHRLVQDRRAGALELLLSTPLTVREIAAGQGRALRRIFGWPVTLLVLGELAAALWVSQSGWQRPSGTDRGLTYLAASSTLVLDLWALSWVGQWRALRGKSVERALAATLASVLAVPWIAYLTLHGLAALLAAFLGTPMSYRALVLSWWAISAGWSLVLGWPARTRFLDDFRECAAGRFDSTPVGGPKRRPTTNAGGTAKPLSNTARGRLGGLWKEHSTACVIGCGILAFVLVGAGRKLYWRSQLRAEARRVRNEGFPAGISEMAPYLAASNSSKGGKDAYALLAVTGCPDPSYTVGSLHGSLAKYPEISAGLRSMAPQLAALRSLTNYESLKVSPRSGMLFANYGSLGRVDYQIAALEQDEERAYADMAGLLQLTGLIRHCGLDQAQPYALGILADVMRVLQSDPILGRAHLARLAQMLEEIDCPTAFQQAIVLSRAPLLDPQFGDPLEEAQGNLAASLAFQLLNVVGSPERNCTEAARLFRSALEISGHGYPERLDLFAELNPSDSIPTPSAWGGQARIQIAAAVRAGILEMLERDAEFSARVAVLKTGLAMRRAKLEGLIFTNVGSLLPQYLAALPMDPFSGEPIRVLRHQGHREVYSVGRNRVDDKDTRHRFNPEADIVFVVP